MPAEEMAIFSPSRIRATASETFSFFDLDIVIPPIDIICRRGRRNTVSAAAAFLFF